MKLSHLLPSPAEVAVRDSNGISTRRRIEHVAAFLTAVVLLAPPSDRDLGTCNLQALLEAAYLTLELVDPLLAFERPLETVALDAHLSMHETGRHLLGSWGELITEKGEPPFHVRLEHVTFSVFS